MIRHLDLPRNMRSLGSRSLAVILSAVLAGGVVGCSSGDSVMEPVNAPKAAPKADAGGAVAKGAAGGKQINNIKQLNNR
jgi:hypothetical protein